MEQFHDRVDAGRHLAGLLERFRGSRPIVLGIARGGVVVAEEVAKALDADLDVLVARKVTAPYNHEYGIGAVGPNGARYFNDVAVVRMGLSREEVQDLATREEAEVRRRLHLYRGDRPHPDLRGRTAILVDDGLATGVTAVAAAIGARLWEPERLVLAVPVCSTQAYELLKKYVDELVSVSIPDVFFAVAQWYEVFDQTTDEEVQAILGGRSVYLA